LAEVPLDGAITSSYRLLIPTVLLRRYLQRFGCNLERKVSTNFQRRLCIYTMWI